MTRKQFNIVVNECRSTKCYHCGCKKSCDALTKIMKTPFLTHFKQLPIELQNKIKEVEI